MMVSLPMYDWPEVRTHTDALWSAIRSQLLPHGFAAPPTLERDIARECLWRDGRLLLSQTCGLPYVSGHCGDAVLLGSPIYDLQHGAGGDYYSLVVVRNDHGAGSLDELRGCRVAYNAKDSQSGYEALLFAIAPLARNAKFFTSSIARGTHRAAIHAIANGDADVAALDAVSWRLALQHEPAASRLRVLTHTMPSPGLPLITARCNEAHRGAICKAIIGGIESLPQESRDALHLLGFRPRPASDYTLLLQRIEQARKLGYTQLH